MVIGTWTQSARRSDGHVESPRSRHGFTLVELLVALILLDVGLLALVGLTAAMSRDADATRQLRHASAIASARIETLASVACAGGTAGAAAAGPAVTESFVETPAPNDTRMLTDSVTVILPSRARTAVTRTRARC